MEKQESWKNVAASLIAKISLAYLVVFLILEATEIIPTASGILIMILEGIVLPAKIWVFLYLCYLGIEKAFENEHIKSLFGLLTKPDFPTVPLLLISLGIFSFYVKLLFWYALGILILVFWGWLDHKIRKHVLINQR